MRFVRVTARILCALSIASIAGPSFASLKSPEMSVGAAVNAPAGLAGFCMGNLDECTKQEAGAVIVTLDAAKQRELDEVQAQINAEIAPREDPQHLWAYPVNGVGDCNKYALAKRRALIALGWPRGALLLTAALTERGEGHLVLVVTTSNGALVLDNRLAKVTDWRELPYRWVEQQSPVQMTQWASLD
jgi:predicted transglutaminase-like cysteine proteinase